MSTVVAPAAPWKFLGRRSTVPRELGTRKTLGLRATVPHPRRADEKRSHQEALTSVDENVCTQTAYAFTQLSQRNRTVHFGEDDQFLEACAGLEATAGQNITISCLSLLVCADSVCALRPPDRTPLSRSEALTNSVELLVTTYLAAQFCPWLSPWMEGRHPAVSGKLFQEVYTNGSRALDCLSRRETQPRADQQARCCGTPRLRRSESPLSEECSREAGKQR